MKNKKVTQARFHVGVNIAGQVLTSCDVNKDKAELELLPIGVLIKVRGEERIVPFSNCLQLSLVSEK